MQYGFVIDHERCIGRLALGFILSAVVSTGTVSASGQDDGPLAPMSITDASTTFTEYANSKEGCTVNRFGGPFEWTAGRTSDGLEWLGITWRGSNDRGDVTTFLDLYHLPGRLIHQAEFPGVARIRSAVSGNRLMLCMGPQASMETPIVEKASPSTVLFLAPETGEELARRDDLVPLGDQGDARFHGELTPLIVAAGRSSGPAAHVEREVIVIDSECRDLVRIAVPGLEDVRATIVAESVIVAGSTVEFREGALVQYAVTQVWPLEAADNPVREWRRRVPVGSGSKLSSPRSIGATLVAIQESERAWSVYSLDGEEVWRSSNETHVLAAIVPDEIGGNNQGALWVLGPDTTRQLMYLEPDGSVASIRLEASSGPPCLLRINSSWYWAVVEADLDKRSYESIQLFDSRSRQLKGKFRLDLESIDQGPWRGPIGLGRYLLFNNRRGVAVVRLPESPSN